MTTLTIVDQEKGGVYKTFLTAHVTTFLESEGLTVRPVDLDYTEGLLTQIFPHPRSANISPSILRLRNRDSLLPQLMSRVIQGERFIIDCGSNTGEAWEMLFTETTPNLLRDFESAGVRITLIVPVDGDPKSRGAFSLYKRLFPTATQILVPIRPYKNCTIPLPNHPERLTLELPPFPDKLFATYLSRAMPFDRIRASDDPSLSIEKGMAARYLPALHAEFQKIKPYLI